MKKFRFNLLTTGKQAKLHLVLSTQVAKELFHDQKPIFQPFSHLKALDLWLYSLHINSDFQVRIVTSISKHGIFVFLGFHESYHFNILGKSKVTHDFLMKNPKKLDDI